MDVRDLAGKAVVVTGAGSGIGRATALAVAKRGGRLFLCDVDMSGLEETARLAGSSADVALSSRVDVAKAEQMADFARAVEAKAGAVDLLVNNAGVGLGARFQDTSLEDWRWIVDINLMGVVHGCHFFIPAMVARRRGHIVNIASMAGYLPTEATTAYSVTKAGVVSLSECLRIELRQYGIGVTVICPGMIDTPIVHAVRTRGTTSLPAARKQMVDSFAKRNYSADRLAENILRAVQRGSMVTPVTPEAWGIYVMKRVAPNLTIRLSEWMGRTLEKRFIAGAKSL